MFRRFYPLEASGQDINRGIRFEASQGFSEMPLGYLYILADHWQLLSSRINPFWGYHLLGCHELHPSHYDILLRYLSNDIHVPVLSEPPFQPLLLLSDGGRPNPARAFQHHCSTLFRTIYFLSCVIRSEEHTSE